jgi:hypothetical protein
MGSNWLKDHPVRSISIRSGKEVGHIIDFLCAIFSGVSLFVMLEQITGRRFSAGRALRYGILVFHYALICKQFSYLHNTGISGSTSGMLLRRSELCISIMGFLPLVRRGLWQQNAGYVGQFVARFASIWGVVIV